MTHKQAKRNAEHFSCVTRSDFGIASNAFGGYSVFILPPEKDRSGSELICEVVRYADIGPQTREKHLLLDQLHGDHWSWHWHEPIVPETLGESADIHQTDIKGLCLKAVYVLLAEGKITIADVHNAYSRAKEGETSSS